MEYKELIKMTVSQLRDEAKKLPDVKSVSGLKKEQLIDILIEGLGIEVPVKKAKKAKPKELDKKTIRKRIEELRAQRDQARSNQNRKQVTVLRRRIHSLKRRLRRVA